MPEWETIGSERCKLRVFSSDKTEPGLHEEIKFQLWKLFESINLLIPVLHVKPTNLKSDYWITCWSDNWLWCVCVRDHWRCAIGLSVDRRNFGFRQQPWRQLNREEHHQLVACPARTSLFEAVGRGPTPQTHPGWRENWRAARWPARAISGCSGSRAVSTSRRARGEGATTSGCG